MSDYYLSVRHIAERLDCSTKTVNRMIREMQKSGRYPASDFILRPRRVKWESIRDWGMRNEK